MSTSMLRKMLNVMQQVLVLACNNMCHQVLFWRPHAYAQHQIDNCNMCQPQGGSNTETSGEQAEAAKPQLHLQPPGRPTTRLACRPARGRPAWPARARPRQPPRARPGRRWRSPAAARLASPPSAAVRWRPAARPGWPPAPRHDGHARSGLGASACFQACSRRHVQGVPGRNCDGQHEPVPTLALAKRLTGMPNQRRLTQVARC